MKITNGAGSVVNAYDRIKVLTRSESDVIVTVEKNGCGNKLVTDDFPIDKVRIVIPKKFIIVDEMECEKRFKLEN